MSGSGDTDRTVPDADGFLLAQHANLGDPHALDQRGLAAQIFVDAELIRDDRELAAADGNRPFGRRAHGADIDLRARCDISARLN